MLRPKYYCSYHPQELAVRGFWQVMERETIKDGFIEHGILASPVKHETARKIAEHMNERVNHANHS